jgi:UDP-glucose 4-epimerase
LHLTFLSSAGCIYTGDNHPFSEVSEAKGTNKYGKLKRKMELTLANSALSHSVLRISNVYGPNQPIGRGQGVIAEWLNAISQGSEIRIFGNLESRRDYIFIDDLIDAIFLTSEEALPGIYNVGQGFSHSLRDVINVLRVNVGQELKFDFQDARPTDRFDFRLDVSKLLREVSWRPRYDLESGIKFSLNPKLTRKSER